MLSSEREHSARKSDINGLRAEFSVTLFFCNHTERLSRKLPFILAYTIWERLPLLVLAGAAYLLAATSPQLVLLALLLALLTISIVGGADGKFMPKAVTTAQKASGYATTTREQTLMMSTQIYDKYQ
jgi:hypothetical protein